MSGRTDGSDAEGTSMTLAFERSAVDALADPRAAFDDARQWSRYIGVVGDDGQAVATTVRRHGLHQDFVIDRLDTRSVLSKLRWEAGTTRYVLVGTTENHRALAEHVGWEYLTIEDAAAKAGWTLATDTGPLDRLRTYLIRVTPSISRNP